MLGFFRNKYEYKKEKQGRLLLTYEPGDMIISLQTEGDVSSQTLRAKGQAVKESAQAVWHMESVDILPEYSTELFMTAQCEADAETPSGNVFYSPRYLQEDPELMGTYESARVIAVTFTIDSL